jgi:hypothetical protein
MSVLEGGTSAWQRFQPPPLPACLLDEGCMWANLMPTVPYSVQFDARANLVHVSMLTTRSIGARDGLVLTSSYFQCSWRVLCCDFRPCQVMPTCTPQVSCSFSFLHVGIGIRFGSRCIAKPSRQDVSMVDGYTTCTARVFQLSSSPHGNRQRWVGI